MADCPKCGHHLKMTDWRPKCPNCGVNMVLYDEQERMMQDADIAEVQYYHFQKKIDRLKASFAGSKLAIVRIFTSLLPIGAIFLPLIKAKVTEPFKPMDGGISILTIVDCFDKLNGDTIAGAMEIGKTPTTFLLVSAALFALSLLALVAHFLLLTLACSPKGKIRNTVLDVIILVTTIGSLIAALAMPDGGAVIGTVGIGGYLYVLLQIANVVVDLMVFKKGITIKHKQCYVGGIPIEEYFEMKEKGMTTEEIRPIQYERLHQMRVEKEERLKKEAEEAEKKKAEEATASGRR